MDNILDHVVVQGQRYDIVSPTAFGDYIETIGSACINPNGYAQGSTFLAKLGNEQFYYEATAAITQGSAISEGTNCKKTTVTGREAELASEIETLGENVDSLNEALTNVDTVISTNGAKNLLPNNGTSQVINGVSFIVAEDGTVTATRTSTSASSALFNIATMDLKAGKYILSGCPVGGDSSSKFVITAYDLTHSVGLAYDVGSGYPITLNSDSKILFRIVVMAAYDISNEVFKPMLTLASQPNSDYAHYVPYAMTNRELTKNVELLSSNITTGLNVYKTGHVVNLKGYVSLQNSDLTINTPYTIGTLPVGYRPGETFVSTSLAYHYSGTTNYYKDAPLSIGYNGNITVTPLELSQSSTTEFAINVMYLV